MEVKKFKLVCEDGAIAYTHHTDIDVVTKLYLNSIFRDDDFSLKKCIAIELDNTQKQN